MARLGRVPFAPWWGGGVWGLPLILESCRDMEVEFCPECLIWFCPLPASGSLESGLGAVWVLRLLKQCPNSYLLGIKLMYVRERDKGRRGRRKGVWGRDKHVSVGSS